MDDLVVWLQAQLIADARRVTALHDLECEIHTHLDAGLPAAVAASRMLEDVPGAVCDCGIPARVLREIDAKRQILALHPYSTRREHVGERWRNDPDPKFDQTFCETCHVDDGIIQRNDGLPCTTLRLLALPYADRPGYKAEEWAP